MRVHQMRRGEFGNSIGIRSGNMCLDKCTEGAIVTSPDVMGIEGSGNVRTGKGTGEPTFKAKGESK